MTLAVTLTVEELRAIVREELLAVQPAPAAQASEILTRKQAAEFLSVSTHHIPKMIRRDGLPAHPFGKGGWRFVRSELVEWVAKRRPSGG